MINVQYVIDYLIKTKLISGWKRRLNFDFPSASTFPKITFSKRLTDKQVSTRPTPPPAKTVAISYTL